MGVKCSKCCPCLNKDKEDEDDLIERERILTDPTSMYDVDGDLLPGCSNGNSSSGGMYGNINGDYDDDDKNDQSNSWGRTLDKMIQSVIDVASMNPSQTVEQCESNERSKVYVARINNIRQKNQPVKTNKKSSKNQHLINHQQQTPPLRKIEIPNKLSGIPEEDIQAINDAVNRTTEAMNKGFHVETVGDLIVDFNP